MSKIKAWVEAQADKAGTMWYWLHVGRVRGESADHIFLDTRKEADDLATRINGYAAVVKQRDEAVRLLSMVRDTISLIDYRDAVDEYLESVKESKDANS